MDFLFRYIIPVLVITLSLSACNHSSSDRESQNTPEPGTVFNPDDSDIQEPDSWYENPGNSVLRVELKTLIEPGGYTLDDINSDTNPHDDFKPEIKVHFQSDDFADDGSSSNATLRIRGNTTRLAAQKSYRVKLDSKKELWRGERRLQLNKHPWDITRVRNKLSFDLFNTIPHLPGLRTQFVHLFIDGQDYGLFTHVEHVGKEYLTNRNWHKDDNLYKAEIFHFYYVDKLKLDEKGQPVDKKAFEQILEIKRGKDHRKLLQMIAGIEDQSTDFTTIFDKHFNRNNYLSWFAATILTGNQDTVAHNFYLYNPAGSDRFYFIPWDYDDAWGYDQQVSRHGESDNYYSARWRRGIGNWWRVPLHRRFLQQPGNLSDLLKAMDEIRANYLNNTAIQTLLDSYHAQIKPLVSRSPDLEHLSIKTGDREARIEIWQDEYNRLIEEPARAQQDFIASLEHPMPFWLHPPVAENGILRLSWDSSHDLQGDQISYDVTVASSPGFETGTTVINQTGITGTYLNYPVNLAPGKYYFRVVARDSKQPDTNWQISFNLYEEENRYYYGILMFETGVSPDS